MKGAWTLRKRPRMVRAAAPFRTARPPLLLLGAAVALALAVPSALAQLSCAALSQPTCTSNADCADPSKSLGMNPNCGNAICDFSTGTCTFEAWKTPFEDPACGATFTACAGVDSSCTKGPSGISKAATGADWVGTCTGWERKVCVYRWCKPGKGGNVVTDTSSATSKCCNVDSDCVAAPGLPALSTCGVGAVRCNKDKNRCEYDSWNSEGVCGNSYFVRCEAAVGAGDSSLCAADKNPARGTGVPMGGECSLKGGKECQFWWCPLGTGEVTKAKPITTMTKITTPTIQTSPATSPSTIAAVPHPTTKPTTKPTAKPTGAPTVITNATQYTCRSPKTACTVDYDCYDIGGIIGADPACGAVRCNTVTGACNFDATKVNCREYYNLCARIDSLCYKGPLTMNYIGTCTGRDRDECQYAWCVNDINSPPDITTTPPTPTATTTTKAGSSTLTSIVIAFGSVSTLHVGANKRFTAKGTYSDNPGVLKDITTKVQWRSSDETKATFHFPGLVQAKGAGVVQITASFSSRSLSISLTITQAQGQVACEVHELNMKALVVYRSKESDELTTLGVMRRTLGYIGVPYDEVSIFDIGSTTTFNDTACRGNYQALFVTDSSLRFVANGLKDKNGLKHEDYARIFGVRTVYWYSYPTEYNGFESTSAPISGGETTMLKFTAEGKEVFSYLTTNSIEVKFSWMYKAKPLPGSIPLLLDAASPPNALALISTQSGREMLSMTFASAENLKYSNILKYGIVNWATRGVFIGNRRIYMTAHMDDFLIDDHIWIPTTPCGTPTDETGAAWRMNRTDLEAVIAYQDRLQADPITADFKLDMVYNGVGATGKRFPLDTLTPLAKKEEAKFKWVTHGWEHLNLDFISHRNAHDELLHNQIITRKRNLGLTHYKNSNMVTGQVSGLKNPDFLTAAYQLGIRFLVTDTSRKGEDPGDNLGLYNWFEERIFMIPRRANNLFYNVALREEWVAEYNCIFRSFWGRDLTVYEIIEVEAEQLLVYLLRGERYPWMFHQANMRLYLAQPENKYTMLLEELLDATIAKYKNFYNLPILSPTMDDLVREVVSHNEIKSHGVRGVLAPGIGLVIESARDTTTPLTGVTIPGAKNMIYGGQEQTYVSLKGNKSLFVEKAGLYKSASVLK